MGSASVLIGGLPAARMGDPTAHGGRIVTGCPTVLIGGNGAGERAGCPTGHQTAVDSQDDDIEITIDGEIGIFDFDYFGDKKTKKKVELKAKWLKKEWALYQDEGGDKDNYIKGLSGKFEASSTIGYDIDEQKYEATLVKLVAEGALGEMQRTATGGKGALNGTVSGAVGKISGDVNLGASYGQGKAEVAAGAGVEAIAIEASGEGKLRITPKTIYDNTVGRLTDTEASSSWDYGVEVGGKVQAGVGAAAKAEAKAALDQGAATVEAELKAGFGPSAGAKIIFGVVWPDSSSP